MPDENSHSFSISADGEVSDTDSQRTVDRISMGSNDSKVRNVVCCVFAELVRGELNAN